MTLFIFFFFGNNITQRGVISLNKNGIRTIGIIFAVCGAVLSLHLFNISLIKSPSLAQNAASQRASGENIKDWRGCIYDCNMIPLTDRYTSPVTAPQGDMINVFARYDENSVAEHLLGYSLSDGSGGAGLERRYDSILKSDTSHSIRYINDATGTPTGKIYNQKNAAYIPQNNIKLTLDYKIQKIAEETADRMLKSGAIVIMDAKSYQRKARVSRPGFDQNDITASMGSAGSPLVNKALAQYNPGSIFKIITSAAAIESGIGDDIKIRCQGEMIIDKKKFVCHKDDGHGEMDFSKGFANSCNCYFYTLAQKCGGDAIINTARDFGLGSALCDDVLNDSGGILPIRELYSPRECANIAIGQGEILITPLQATYMTTIIANGGIASNVNLAHSIVDHEGNIVQNLLATGSRIVISPETASKIASMMRLCVTEGTATAANIPHLSIAGKTGTAQTGWMDDGTAMVHGWFCGFFPYENPKYAMTVFCENGQSGSEACIPIFREIAERINVLYN